MPRKTVLLSATCLLFIHCKKKDTIKTPIVPDTIKLENAKPATSKLQDHSPAETVESFVKWYRDNEDNLSRFNTIKGGPQAENETPVNYAIDFDQVDKEISFLKSSKLLSEKFLATYRQNYVEGDEYFKKNPANDGPPHGFDYDYFFKTQDDYQSDLNHIEAVKFIVKPVNSQLSYVEFHLKNCEMTYKYTLVKNNKDQWQIDSIENITR
ncbi:CAAX amino terminal protease family protein [Chryseobacterium sp. StRB126]|uniref:DUF3828 domain-containing protein n=1 Tax=Chryseobacterium sp. StRB126 TaxID=878220 RepID=UPI0004E997AD|nr:DUF3828 domain-containing protein [Chryseobacterium sp. StRB126]BAP31390.1 CAAX amino terminal protease family protein [Chryseobacterium sp. StRB126]